jgi:glucokinase
MALDRPYNHKYISCGDFEYNASGEGIIKVAKEMLARDGNNKSVLKKYNPDLLSAKDIFDAYEMGDELSKKVIANAIECWGMATA